MTSSSVRFIAVNTASSLSRMAIFTSSDSKSFADFMAETMSELMPSARLGVVRYCDDVGRTDDTRERADAVGRADAVDRFEPADALEEDIFSITS
jgi:hypothetical protein